MNTMPSATLAPSGTLGLATSARVKAPLGWRLRNLRHQARALPALLAYRLLGALFGLVYFESALRLELHQADGTLIDYGVVGRRVVTTAGVNFIVDAFQNIVELESMSFHGFGTGGAAEAVGNTALTTELTTQYATDNVRPTGTTTEGASANIYRTVATLSPDTGGTIAVTEHGIFSQAAVAGGTLLDRTLFAAINVVAGSGSLQATYELTLTAGS